MPPFLCATAAPITPLAAPPAADHSGWVRIRPLTDGEVETVSAVFEALSARSRFLRFRAPWPRLPAAMRRYLATVRPGWHETFVAVGPEGPVGLARWIREEGQPDRAEVALEVADSRHRQGVGRCLVRHAAATAQAAGMRELTFVVHPENRVMREWLARLEARPSSAERDRFILATSDLAGWLGAAPVPA